jgi:hypothetical protein
MIEEIAHLLREREKDREIMRVLSARISSLERMFRDHLGLSARRGAAGDFVTIKQAAHELGMTISGVRNRIKVGDIRAQKVGGKVLVDRKSLRAFTNELSNFHKLKVERPATVQHGQDITHQSPAKQPPRRRG